MAECNNIDLLNEVLRAAEAVLEARENQMLTTDEWDALQHAVAAATQPPEDGLNETFSVAERILTRSVIPKRGEPYRHTCDMDVYEAVAHAVDDLNGASFTYEEIRKSIDAPFTQVAVAIAFLKERGCIVLAHRRRSVAAAGAGCVHLDAMIEWHALPEGSAGST